MIIGQVAGLATLAGPSALVAVVATVLGAVFLGLFFAKGGLWGPLNDVASIVMMLATIPVLAFFATWTEPYLAGGVAGAVAAVGLVGMLGAATAQGLLVARIRTYKQLLPWTLGKMVKRTGEMMLIRGGIIALAIGLIPMASLTSHAALYVLLALVAIGYGFWRGNERHPLSIVGGIVLLVASTIFLAWIGVALIAASAVAQ